VSSLRSVLTTLSKNPLVLQVRKRTFKGTTSYWEERYAKGGTSGAGSYGEVAQWKAEIVNAWVDELGVTSVVDLGCGDGNQLGLAKYPRYLGLDPSATAVRLCMKRFRDDPTKSFIAYDPSALADPAGWLRGDLALSQEVIFHLIEEELFENYMNRLFDSAERYVVICSNATSGSEQGPTERHRDFTKWIERNRPEWELDRRVEPPSGLDIMSSFFLYKKKSD
jgi:SAM-dependent methyltransferase